MGFRARRMMLIGVVAMAVSGASALVPGAAQAFGAPNDFTVRLSPAPAPDLDFDDFGGEADGVRWIPPADADVESGPVTGPLVSSIGQSVGTLTVYAPSDHGAVMVLQNGSSAITLHLVIGSEAPSASMAIATNGVMVLSDSVTPSADGRTYSFTVTSYDEQGNVVAEFSGSRPMPSVPSDDSSGDSSDSGSSGSAVVDGGRPDPDDDRLPACDLRGCFTDSIAD